MTNIYKLNMKYFLDKNKVYSSRLYWNKNKIQSIKLLFNHSIPILLV